MKTQSKLLAAAMAAARSAGKFLAATKLAIRCVPDFIKGVHLLPLYNCAAALCATHNHTIAEIWKTTDMHWWIAVIILIEVCVELSIDEQNI